jgi:16S rRNA (adenine1518-N6/adenine1519-N6)-dimethyltransferase
MILVKPKKSLGQHFLKDKEVAARISQSLAAFKGFPVLEIGPGTGVLTRFLLQEGYDLRLIEIDHESVLYLKENLQFPSERIWEGDFLQLSLDKLYDSPFCIIGNFPYYISSQILFKVLTCKDQVICCVGMFQKEVA